MRRRDEAGVPRARQADGCHARTRARGDEGDGWRARARARRARAALESEKHLALLDRANRERAVSARARYEKLTTTQSERFDEYSRRAEAYERALSRLRLRTENADVVRDIVHDRLADEERDLDALREYEAEDDRALKDARGGSEQGFARSA